MLEVERKVLSVGTPSRADRGASAVPAGPGPRMTAEDTQATTCLAGVLQIQASVLA